jgi:hypothetical protein
MSTSCLRVRSFLLEQTRINFKSLKFIVIIEGIQARFIPPLHYIRNEHALIHTNRLAIPKNPPKFIIKSSSDNILVTVARANLRGYGCLMGV